MCMEQLRINGVGQARIKLPALWTFEKPRGYVYSLTKARVRTFVFIPVCPRHIFSDNRSA